MSAAPPLYLHVADDGGILLVDGASGRSSWITAAEAARQVEGLAAAGGALLLSQERGSVAATPVLVEIEAAGVPIVAAREVHPDAHRDGGLTALMSAAYLGALELLDDLVARGADLEARDASGYTALMYAANGDQPEALARLLAAGAAVDATDAEGSTPLMFAAQRGSLPMVRALLGAGADPKRRRVRDGLTAWDFASGNDHGRVAAVLLAAG